jgi:ubiquinone/menaquinone biosynthesis C-methylase UbiE
MRYYENKLKFLENLFDKKIELSKNSIKIENQSFKIVNDVIILDEVRAGNKTVTTFGTEWAEFSKITHEHFDEFKFYFDLVRINDLKDKIVCDFGCGIGRWSKLLIDRVGIKYLILCDYSNSINEARKQFLEYDNVIYLQCDIENINFKKNIIDFFYSLGVLHHLPTKYSRANEKIAHCSKEGIIYLYYNLDKKPSYYQYIFKLVDIIRKYLSKIKSESKRKALAYLLTILLYYPMLILNIILSKLKFNTMNLPLNYYKNFSFFRIRQNVYDRFFTDIENRYTKEEIKKYYKQYFKNIKFSNKAPYWHFHLAK